MKAQLQTEIERLSLDLHEARETLAGLRKEIDELIHDNAEYVSAAGELATENQRLRKALKECARIIKLDRDSLSDTHRDPKTGQVEERLGREGLAEYDRALAMARAALSETENG